MRPRRIKGAGAENTHIFPASCDHFYSTHDMPKGIFLKYKLKEYYYLLTHQSVSYSIFIGVVSIRHGAHLRHGL